MYYNPTLKLRDEMKNNYAKEKNIPLIRIPYKIRDKITIEDILSDKWII